MSNKKKETLTIKQLREMFNKAETDQDLLDVFYEEKTEPKVNRFEEIGRSIALGLMGLTLLFITIGFFGGIAYMVIKLFGFKLLWLVPIVIIGYFAGKWLEAECNIHKFKLSIKKDKAYMFEIIDRVRNGKA